MMSTIDVIREIDHENLTVRLLNNQYVHVILKPHTEITVELQVEMVALYREVTNGKKMPFLFEGGEFVSITKEARENAIKMEDDTPTLASAILVKNLAQKIVADFYYKINKPKQPYKVFWSKEKAILWIEQL
jgi:hypothetical protein